MTFAERGAAERAADALQNKLIIRGQRAKLCWGKPQERRADAPAAGAPPPSMMPPQVRNLAKTRTPLCMSDQQTGFNVRDAANALPWP